MGTGRTRVWIFTLIGLTVSLMHLSEVFRPLRERIGPMQWLLLALVLFGPLFGIYRYLRQVDEMDDSATTMGVQFALAAYVPIWVGLDLVKRVAIAP